MRARFPPAIADDASLKAAGVSHDAQFKKLAKGTRRAFRKFKQAQSVKPLIKLFRAVRREIKAVTAAVKAEQPSTPRGVEYKSRLLASLRELRKSVVYDERSVREAARGHERAARRWLARANRQRKLSKANEKLAVKALP